MTRTVLIWLACLLLAACGSSDSQPPALPATGGGGAPPPPSISLQLVVSGLSNPVDITGAGDGSTRLFIVEQAGGIRIFDGAQLLTVPFLDIAGLVLCCGERGLLGLAFHPDFAGNGFFFVNYTDANGDTVIARYQISAADPNLADPNSALILLTVPQPFSNHNGGQLRFGPDGFLYVGLGDGGSGGDPLDSGQRLDTLLGKILRLDVDTVSPFAIPPSNPFVGTPGARGEIWVYGLRNPWRFSFDRLTGDLFIGDVGQSSREEIDFQPVSSLGGENFGWRRMEGTACFNPSANCNDGTLTLPIVEYDHTAGDCSVTGGFRYRGAQFPSLSGVYFYADFCTGRIWSATRNADGSWTAQQLLDTALSIATFGEDDAGELFLADHAGGTLHRITAAP